MDEYELMKRQYEAMLAMAQGGAVEEEYEPEPELDEYELLKRQYEGEHPLKVDA